MQWLKRFFKRKTLRGFSMGEVVLASFVLSTGLLSVSALISKGLKDSMTSRDSIVAAELAQEGVELVRNVRDNDFMAGNNGFSSFSSDQHCRIDYNDTGLDCNPSQGTSSRYSLHYSGSMYAHTGSSPERFYRYIYINYSNSSEPSAIVRSFVFWGVNNPDTMLSSLSGGNTSNCTLIGQCVYTESTLTAWK